MPLGGNRLGVACLAHPLIPTHRTRQLFGNVAVNVLISILMSDLTSGLVGFFASTILIVIIGDILPQVKKEKWRCNQ